jgi:predicted amidohydrolase YtcJ
MNILIVNCATLGGKTRSILIESGRIARTSEEQALPARAGTLTIDAKGATVLPGFIDTHCHPFDFGASKRGLELRGTSSIVSMRLRLEGRIRRASPGEWVVGTGWDQEAFSEGRYPRSADIDGVSRDNPVVLTRVCGHIALFNSRAMEALGLGAASAGEVEKDENGVPTGIVKEGALEMAYGAMPADSVETKMSDLLTAERDAAKFGLSTIHCILSSDGWREEAAAMLRLRADGRLSLRYRLFVPPAALKDAETRGVLSKLDDDRVRVNGVKIFADGSMGARTAALRQPYNDDPGNFGVLRHSDAQLNSLASDADGLGYQVIIHAIGDRAVEQAIDAVKPLQGGARKRHRIEHASLAPPDLRREMRRHSIRAAVQPHFMISDTWARQRLGDERARELYPIGSMLRAGIVVSGGSDSPVETLSPLLGMWAAMVAADYNAEEKLDLSEAVGLYTSNAAANGFDEPDMGEVREGAAADLVLLDSNVEGYHPALLRKVGVAATIVDGKLVYSYEGLDTAGV